MGLYTENIVKREENNKMLEQYADDALLNDHSMLRVEEDIEDVQSALLYMLERFGLRVTRIPRQPSVESLLETMLDPLGMMYEEKSTVAEACQKRSEYVLAFRHDGKAVVLMPTITGLPVRFGQGAGDEAVHEFASAALLYRKQASGEPEDTPEDLRIQRAQDPHGLRLHAHHHSDGACDRLRIYPASGQQVDI